MHLRATDTSRAKAENYVDRIQFETPFPPQSGGLMMPMSNRPDYVDR